METATVVNIILSILSFVLAVISVGSMSDKTFKTTF